MRSKNTRARGSIAGSAARPRARDKAGGIFCAARNLEILVFANTDQAFCTARAAWFAALSAPQKSAVKQALADAESILYSCAQAYLQLGGKEDRQRRAGLQTGIEQIRRLYFWQRGG